PAPSLWVPRTQCTVSSTRWLTEGTNRTTIRVAAHGGSADRNDSIMAPQNPDTTGRNRRSVTRAAIAAPMLPKKLTEKNIAPLITELSSADFQFHRLNTRRPGLRTISATTSVTDGEQQRVCFDSSGISSCKSRRQLPGEARSVRAIDKIEYRRPRIRAGEPPRLLSHILQHGAAIDQR